MRTGRLLASFLLLLPGWSPTVAAPFPYPLRVEVRFEGEGGTQSIADALKRAIEDTLVARGCASRIVRDDAPTPSDPVVVLSVVVEEFLEELVYDTTLQEQARPTDPGSRTAFTAVMDLTVRLEVLAPAAGKAPIHSTRLRETTRFRPFTHLQDAEAEARRRAFDRLAHAARRLLCRKSKVARKARQAMEARPPR